MDRQSAQTQAPKINLIGGIGVIGCIGVYRCRLGGIRKSAAKKKAQRKKRVDIIFSFC